MTLALVAASGGSRGGAGEEVREATAWRGGD